MENNSNWTNKSESIAKLAQALCKAQAIIEAVKKDSNNPFFKSKYADLANVWAAIREPLSSNGLCILQEPSRNENSIVITTTLIHESGEFVRSSLEMPVTKQDPQGYGSAITYARRYALGAIVGIAPEDDDGNAASGGDKKPTIEPKKMISNAAMYRVTPEQFDELGNETGYELYDFLENNCKRQVNPDYWVAAKPFKKIERFRIDWTDDCLKSTNEASKNLQTNNPAL